MDEALRLSALIHSFQSRHLTHTPPLDQQLQFAINNDWQRKCQSQKQQVQEKGLKRMNLGYEQCREVVFYEVVCLLFAGSLSESDLDIYILDTMFFQNDHSIHYIYKDYKKGLVKIKQKGMTLCELFLKRKQKVRSDGERGWKGRQQKGRQQKGRQQKERQYKSNLFRQQKGQCQKVRNGWIAIQSNRLIEQRGMTVGNDLGYICLLRYKDGSFIRLKQYELRSIFTNPLYANEKFNYNNCTQYIQCLCEEGAEEWKIHYRWQQFKDQALFQMAVDCLLNTLNNQQIKAIKAYLSQQHPLIYLYFLVFEICSFMTIRHNRRMIKGLFSFVKDKEQWCLANVQEGEMMELGLKQFCGLNMWQNRKKVKFSEVCCRSEKEEQLFRDKSQARCQLQKQMERCFQATNNRIKKDMVEFVESKMDNVEKQKDKLLSKTIFQILHPHQKENLFDLLESPNHFHHIIQPKTPNLKPKVSNFVKDGSYTKKRKTLKRECKPVYIYKGIETS